MEYHFRQLDRRVRERIALWEGSKGELLESIMGERDAISDSDQGRSFRAFWDFLLSSRRQEELTQLLHSVLALPAIAQTTPDARTHRIHYDWLEAGEHTQRTLAALSHQLRRFLDDQAWLENRRIMDLLHSIESNALSLRASLPSGSPMHISEIGASLNLPMERPLFTPALKPFITALQLEAGDENIDPSKLFEQIVIDKSRLSRHIRQALQAAGQISLQQLLHQQPLQQGLAELVTYLQLACDSFTSITDESTLEPIHWQAHTPDGHTITRSAQLPRLIFMR